MKNLIRKILVFLGIHKSYAERLREQGVSIGKNTVFVDSRTNTIDVGRPYLLEIGKDSLIGKGVIILTHDYSRTVLRKKFGELIGEGRKTVIGDNVFIGMNAIILMGTHIGNNVIVGAGSVVSGDIPDDVVIAGNPAKIIRTIEEHYKTRQEKTLLEAKETVNAFYNKYKRIPTIKECDPFWWLFMPRNLDAVKQSGVFTKLSADNEEEMLATFMNTKPKFDSFEKFIDWCFEKGTN